MHAKEGRGSDGKGGVPCVDDGDSSGPGAALSVVASNGGATAEWEATNRWPANGRREGKLCRLIHYAAVCIVYRCFIVQLANAVKKKMSVEIDLKVVHHGTWDMVRTTPS